MKMDLADVGRSAAPAVARNIAEDGELAAPYRSEKSECAIAAILGDLLEGEAAPVVALVLAQLESG